jgi:hypothetical protein
MRTNQPRPAEVESVKLTKAQHPLTAKLMDPDGYVPKRYVRRMSGASRYQRPFWRSTWECWCIQDGGPQQIFWDDINGEYTVTRPAGRAALQQSTAKANP